MFKTRLLSGILLVIIALATIISGDYVLFFTLLAVSLIGMRELYRAMKVQDEKINLLAAAGYLGAVLYYLAVLLDFERYGVLAIIFGLVLNSCALCRFGCWFFVVFAELEECEFSL